MKKPTLSSARIILGTFFAILLVAWLGLDLAGFILATEFVGFAFLGGLILFTIVLVATFVQRMTPTQLKAMGYTATGPEDQEIAGLVKTLVSRAGIDHTGPIEVRWEKSIKFPQRAITRTLSPDDPMFLVRRGALNVILATDLRGRLNADDWRPLLASSLLRQTSMSRTRKRLFATWVGIQAVIVSILLTAVGFYFTGNELARFTIALDSSAFAIVVAVGFLMGNRASYQAVLHADGIVASEIGQQSLLRSLQKIEAMKLDRENRHGHRTLRRLFFGKPALSIRVKNLETLPAN